MTTWQTIDTAPRDGRLIIAARFKDASVKWVRDARWFTAAEIADMQDGIESDYDPAWASLDDEEDPIYPTHWMPMPEPA